MPNQEKNVDVIVDRGVDAVIAGDSKGKVFTSENAGQVASVGKDILQGAMTGAVKGAIKGAVAGALEEVNKAAGISADQASNKGDSSEVAEVNSASTKESSN